eukprot:TRINITY_DN70657_c0_g1_i1.p1 TRINITY_DN70657_c0_g1~~TRINITY_DN70657_c0_g1_i1.p1  ORF type:complete len:282 (+),score=30.98 TRINITY_DN70657_c0_g1_i1:336-1181(+)
MVATKQVFCLLLLVLSWELFISASAQSLSAGASPPPSSGLPLNLPFVLANPRPIVPFPRFVAAPRPDGPNGAFCNVRQQDCPSGFKCISETLNGQPRCRALSHNPDSVGDDCDTLMSNDGDSCDVDGICVNGVCQPLCQPSDPPCPGATDLCHIYGGGVPLCEMPCFPLINGVCKEHPNTFCSSDSGVPDGRFTCVQDTGEPLGLQGASCVRTSQCRQGFFCVVKTRLPAAFCDDSNTLQCCTALAEDGDDCPQTSPSLSLVPLFQSAPPGLERLGVCVLF